MSEVSACPSCGAQLPGELVGGEEIFNCPSCGQAVHPADCQCMTCLLQTGLSALKGIKDVRREDEAERLRLGLPPKSQPQSPHGTTVVTINGPSISISGVQQKACSQCGTLNRMDANFCKNCGDRF